MIRILPISAVTPAIYAERHPVYIGQNYANFHQLSAFEIALPAPLSAEDQRQYEDFIINIDSLFENSRLLPLTNSAAHNRYISRLPDLARRARMALAHALNNPDCIFITDTHNDAELIGGFLNANGPFQTRYPQGSFFGFINRLRQVKKILLTTVQTLRAITHANRHRLTHALNKPNIFITWLSDGMESVADQYNNNRYFGDFANTCGGPPNVAIIGKFPSGRLSLNKESAFPLVSDASHYKDAFKAFFLCFNIFPYLCKQYSYQSINYTSLVRSCLWDDFLTGSFFESLIDHFAFRRLIQLSPDTKYLYYPFENQPWEKALLLALRQEAARIAPTAFQFFPFPVALTMHAFSIREKDKNFLPAAIVTTDMTTNSLLQTQGIQTIPTINQRYKSLLSDKYACSSVPKTPIVMASLFLERDEALELAVKSIEATKISGHALWINFHPMTAPSVKDEIMQLAHSKTHVTIKEDRFVSLASSVSLILYNQSSVAFDAVLRGIPALHIKSDLLPSLDRLAGPVLICANAKNAAHNIQNILGSPNTYETYATSLYKYAIADLYNSQAHLKETRA